MKFLVLQSFRHIILKRSSPHFHEKPASRFIFETAKLNIGSVTKRKKIINQKKRGTD